ncbi:MAG: hypothetical protein FJ381_10595 [Verrucomicrobia bacterium]|nr:hypothetical protein [Verrucomicrobiota bacterium]
MRKNRAPTTLPGMTHRLDAPAALRALQNDIYREQIRRARQLTIQQRLNDVFDLSNHMFGMMLGGAMHRLNTRDEAAGWVEVRRWMGRMDRARDHGFYRSDKPTAP